MDSEILNLIKLQYEGLARCDSGNILICIYSKRCIFDLWKIWYNLKIVRAVGWITKRNNLEYIAVLGQLYHIEMV